MIGEGGRERGGKREGYTRDRGEGGIGGRKGFENRTMQLRSSLDSNRCGLRLKSLEGTRRRMTIEGRKDGRGRYGERFRRMDERK